MNRRLAAALACALTVTLCSLAPRPAHAQRVSGMNGTTVWGIIAHWDGVGIGGRYMLPLGNKGLISSGPVRDRFGLELGADLVHWEDRWHDHDYDFTALVPTAGVLWAFWVTPELALYPKIDLGFGIGWHDGWDDRWGDDPDTRYDGIFAEPSLGLIWRLSSVALRAEASGNMLKLGAGFGF